ncbi:MAG: hypothetical protein Q8P53_03645 [Candidatus Shapirobacteria bacterium]|nr:hypothetical protein [Candidatus Shapirobacteria bacterium]
MYPPKKLFAKNAWFSFDLRDNQEKIKLDAITKNISQLNPIPFQDLLRSFVRKNEIFQVIE